MRQFWSDTDLSQGFCIYLLFLSWTTIVHLGVYITLLRIPEYSPHTIYALRVLVLGGYCPPMLYGIRALYLGLFAPSIAINVNASLYMIFVGMGGYFLQACTTSRVLPIFDYQPRFWVLKCIYYLGFVVPLFSAIGMVIAFTASWVYDDAIDAIDAFETSIARKYASCANSSCIITWPTILAYVSLAVFLLWVVILILLYGRRLPDICTDIQFVVLNDALPGTGLWFAERFPFCARHCGRLCVGCCKDDDGRSINDAEEADEEEANGEEEVDSV